MANVPVRTISALFLLMFLILPETRLIARDSTLTTVILVRHAEKADDGTGDPELSRKGEERAERLAAFLSETDITAIYTTPFHRTSQTVAPLARRKNLQTLEYDPHNREVLDEILSGNEGKTIVICGHSNTIPQYLNRLTRSNEYKSLDEDDYGTIFILTLSKNGDSRLVHLRY